MEDSTLRITRTMGPCVGVQLYHGALSERREDGKRVFHTPQDPVFEEARKQLQRN